MLVHALASLVCCKHAGWSWRRESCRDGFDYAVESNGDTGDEGTKHVIATLHKHNLNMFFCLMLYHLWNSTFMEAFGSKEAYLLSRSDRLYQADGRALGRAPLCHFHPGVPKDMQGSANMQQFT